MRTRASLAAVTLLLVPLFAACATFSLSSGDDSVFDLEVGHCFNAADELDIGYVELVPCGDPHENEVYAVIDYPAGPSEPWPGDKPISAMADRECVSTFDAYVGISYESSRFIWAPLLPTESTWTDGGDREIVCALYDEKPTTGSAKGSRE